MGVPSIPKTSLEATSSPPRRALVSADRVSPSITAEAYPAVGHATREAWSMATGVHQMDSEVAMMVIVLLSPTLQTLHMDSLSSTRHGTTLMGITKGMGTNRTTSEELARDPEEFREAALRQCALERAFS